MTPHAPHLSLVQHADGDFPIPPLPNDASTEEAIAWVREYFPALFRRIVENEQHAVQQFKALETALFEYSTTQSARSDIIAERLQSLHDAIKGNTEADQRFREQVLDALRTLSDWTQEHAAEHRAEGVHREKQDSLHDAAEIKHDAAIAQLEVDKANLQARQAELALGQSKLAIAVAQHEAARNKLWAQGGKWGSFFSSILLVLEAVTRIMGVDGVIGLFRKLFGGH